MTRSVDILIPTYNRPEALAVTLTSLVSQTFQDFRIIISDQSPSEEGSNHPVLQAVERVLRSHDIPLVRHHHLPRLGLAEQRQYVLDHSRAPLVLFLDDDLILESYVIEQMLTSIRRFQCGFVGSAVIGLSFKQDIRPHEQSIEFWDDAIRPERVIPGLFRTCCSPNSSSRVSSRSRC